MKTFNLLLSALFVVGMAVSAQDTTFYKEGKKVKTLELADRYVVNTRDTTDKNLRKEQTYYKSGAPKSEVMQVGVYKQKAGIKDSTFIGWVNDGLLTEWYESGVIAKYTMFKNGRRNGKLLLFWENGRKKREEIFKDDKFIQGVCFDSEGNEVEYFPYETMPSFPGGEKTLLNYLSESIRYPFSAMREGIQGRVIIQFVVESNGEIKEIRVVRGVSPELNAEALRVIRQMPLWIPGTQDGKPVRINYVLPVNFRMQ